jgi:glyoxalase family protein
MENKITGLHHVNAIATDPRRNLDFYVGLLGLRLPLGVLRRDQI